MKPLEVNRRPLSVEIVEARVAEDQTGSTFFLCADDGGEILRMEIRALDNDYHKNLQGQSALHYLLGELGMMDIDTPDDFVSKTLHRWAWDKVASIAASKTTPEPAHTTTSPRGDKHDAGRFVYVISANDNDPPLCKIGIANSPEKRLTQLSTGSPHALRLEMARYANNASAVERAAHSHFGDYRRNGEWFAIEPDEAIEFIISTIRNAA
ncbi:GIY-YIG nuclease family protein [Rhizobium leucaenae]|uniref:GIY-YIG nuclease family protein n=1 Tax=Rhizobium leucaenae TaxID=29450 RepID=UPI0016105C0B|nr:GIY-YIG nuclease family protein [Rhizobium leucaenae]MBB6299928.1 hypothetical protein [Rhizobium leucaenae]